MSSGGSGLVEDQRSSPMEGLTGLSRFVQFSVVGAIGFSVDAGVLQGLISIGGWGPVEARAVAIPLAVLATWQLNRTMTFRDLRHPIFLSLARYVAVSAFGAAVNFAVYTMLVLGSSAMAATPIAPLAIASTVALVFNFYGSKRFAFR